MGEGGPVVADPALGPRPGDSQPSTFPSCPARTRGVWGVLRFKSPRRDSLVRLPSGRVLGIEGLTGLSRQQRRRGEHGQDPRVDPSLFIFTPSLARPAGLPDRRPWVGQGGASLCTPPAHPPSSFCAPDSVGLRSQGQPHLGRSSRGPDPHPATWSPGAESHLLTSRAGRLFQLLCLWERSGRDSRRVRGTGWVSQGGRTGELDKSREQLRLSRPRPPAVSAPPPLGRSQVAPDSWYRGIAGGGRS